VENYVCAHASESITHLNKNTLGVYLWQACIAAALSTLEHAMRVEVCSLVDTHARECRPTREVPAGTSPPWRRRQHIQSYKAHREEKGFLVSDRENVRSRMGWS